MALWACLRTWFVGGTAKGWRPGTAYAKRTCDRAHLKCRGRNVQRKVLDEACMFCVLTVGYAQSDERFFNLAFVETLEPDFVSLVGYKLLGVLTYFYVSRSSSVFNFTRSWRLLFWPLGGVVTLPVVPRNHPQSLNSFLMGRGVLDGSWGGGLHGFWPWVAWG